MAEYRHICRLCKEEPHPKSCGHPRTCAFNADGSFAIDNWNCGTLNALIEGQTYGHPHQIEGCDESMNLVYLGEDFWYPDDQEGGDNAQRGGWIVLTRYKHRGRCSSAIWVGDFFPPQPLTLELAEMVLAAQHHSPPSNRGA